MLYNVVITAAPLISSKGFNVNIVKDLAPSPVDNVIYQIEYYLQNLSAPILIRIRQVLQVLCNFFHFLDWVWELSEVFILILRLFIGLIPMPL